MSKDLRFSVPFNKVDKVNRIVSGWASLDNEDQQGDIVTAKCSSEAFATFKGNLREMHQPIAIGKVVDFREDTYIDADTEKIYNGVWVSAYVSKGAEDAWEKVLDGTYSGFSIGGKIDPDSVETIFDKGSPIRVVNKMVLYELSLVDSPANQLCSIMAIQKSKDGSLSATGIASNVSIEDVFYCKPCEILASGSNEKDCIKCHDKMTSIGWVEHTDNKSSAKEIQKVLKNYIKKEGETMSENELEKANKKPYGDVQYADPGYQKDKQKRYPIDTEEHVRAALSYINQSDNAGKYSSEHLKSIKSKIAHAAKKFGIKVSDTENKSMSTQEENSDLDLEKSEDVVVTADSEELDVEKGTNPSVNTQYSVDYNDMDDDDLPKGELVNVQPQDDYTESEVEVAQRASEDAVNGVGQSSTGAPAVPQGVDDPMASTQPLSQNNDPVVNHVVNDDLKAVIVQTVKDALASLVTNQEKMLSKANKKTEKRLAEIEDLVKESAKTAEDVAKVLEARVEDVEGSTAIKKSGELGSESGVKKSVWNGAFSVPGHFFGSDSVINNKEGR